MLHDYKLREPVTNSYWLQKANPANEMWAVAIVATRKLETSKDRLALLIYQCQR